MNATVHVAGIREVNAAFRKIDRKLASEFGNDLKKAAAPVLEDAKTTADRWGVGGTIRSRRAGPAVYVQQSARKTTGLRPDFGALQMREALIPALEDNRNAVFTEVERVLNKYANSAGF